jgi:hypothetical protein
MIRYITLVHAVRNPNPRRNNSELSFSAAQGYIIQRENADVVIGHPAAETTVRIPWAQVRELCEDQPTTGKLAAALEDARRKLAAPSPVPAEEVAS